MWVLTGDKEDTAINIGFACKLLRDDMHEAVIRGEWHDEEEWAYANWAEGAPKREAGERACVATSRDVEVKCSRRRFARARVGLRSPAAGRAASFPRETGSCSRRAARLAQLFAGERGN